MELKDCIRNIPDFPKPGILFKDITTLLKDKKAFKLAVDALVTKYKNKDIDSVVAVEARGFILGGAIAERLGAGFVPVRKKGKLPAKTNSVTYNLEYGTDTLEMHHDAINPGDKVLIVDDLLATGGTVEAVTKLIGQLQGKIAGIAFLIELTDLKGADKLKGYPVYSLIKY
ncbi:MAG: adenine phosphoribosyltransferase [Candidatus Omnitrophica bacterium]|nr:adenine phosphoribosyltransferase [Candidatus Omnitrophota bacterium]MBU4473261.1 adenine phosphoribosyltransferase [Candidatus Omnitrophota bacterium]MCG2706067.1 adenine phosphoribosyltransferase [Candidatus Omnitrophota bacterium]